MSNTATGRRTKFGLQTIALIAAITAAAAFLLLITSRVSFQLDQLTTREHRLSARTIRLLEKLDDTYDLVIAGNLRELDPRTKDTLDTFARVSDKIRFTPIDTFEPSGMREYEALMGELAGRSGSEIASQASTIAGVTQRATQMTNVLRSLAESLEASAPQGGRLRDFCTSSAAVCRVRADELGLSIQRAEQATSEQYGAVPVPRIDLAKRELRVVLDTIARDLGTIAGDMDRVANTEGLEIANARVLADRTAALRDVAARAEDELRNLKPLAILQVAAVLESSNAVLVIGPPDAPGPSVTAIDFDAMFAGNALGAEGEVRLDERHRAEQLVVTALASLTNQTNPVVVVVHGAEQEFGTDFQFMRTMAERLRLRNIELIEWATAVNSNAPVIGADRPAVYFIIPSFTSSAQSAARMGALASAVDQLIENGEDVLVTCVPSTLPGYGNPDPLVEALEAQFGMRIGTGTPLLRQVRGPQGAIVSSRLAVTPDREDQPIAGAVRGLNTLLLWAVPIQLPEATGDVRPILTINDTGVWGESEWLGFRETPRAQRENLINPPQPDSPRDLTDGPFHVAVAAERRLSTREEPQRVVVIGSHGWYFDPIVDEFVIAGNRRVPARAGNIELFEASIYWLAHQDDMVVTSEVASAIPVIQPISAGAMRAVKWGLIGGLPLLVLLVGVAQRLIRR